jgi:16S rRNA (cytosine1402-N4)-methyltransferase
MTYHNPVLLQPCIDLLNLRPDGTYVDVTFGGGGHSRAILAQLGPKGRLIAFDQDPDAQANAIDDPRFTLVPHNFEHLKRFLKLYGAL